MDYPAYLGAGQQRTRLEPVFSAEYDRRYYLGSSRVGPGFGGGVHLLRQDGFVWDLGLGVGDSRPESRSPLLAGLGDRRSDLFAGTGLHYTSHGFHVGVTWSYGLRDDTGNRVTLTAGQMVRLAPRWDGFAGVHGTWADADAMNYDFGITPAQAANRANLVVAGAASLTPAQIGPYTAAAGARDAGVNLGVNYHPKPRWTWTLNANSGVLLGDARTSPLAARTSYWGGGLGFAYRF
jgi:outer membrane scaffolding protein for murein synthesis (MipA/OmpV family)